MQPDSSAKLKVLKASLDGELHDDQMMRSLYATDASVYRELPLAVAYPRHADDLKQLIHFARTAGTSLIPRAGGTSLAGQCVGAGIVVDCSRYFTGILELNATENWVRVQPGVIRDDLNHYLRPHGLFFGPNTSTANRAMIGGMVGNNSCGSYSLVYGTTRDHVMELKGLLSDGSEVVLGPLTAAEFADKCTLDTLEGGLYRQIRDELNQPEQQAEIRTQFPKGSIHRRNTGYAIDVLLNSNVFTPEGPAFNFASLICGSEGTLALITEIKLHVDSLPPPVTGLLCVHHESIQEALEAVLVAMRHQPRAVELMDKIVLDCTKGNRLYQAYRFFVQGDPEAILIMEVGGESQTNVEEKLQGIARDFQAAGLGYHFPTVLGPDISKVWALRKAGLGLLANVPGDAKPVAVIEDTAVQVDDLPAYIAEFSQLLQGYGQQAVYYAHAGAGELHLRPLLDLKDPKDRKDFRGIAHDTAVLVKKYQGSLSGEHGDGRVRAEFIPLMVGEKNYALFKRVKSKWDPQGIFNPGKIVDAAPMDTSLRYEAGQETRQFDTLFDFSATEGILRAAEKCNGSGDCRKSPLAGGTMCPSYMATREEKDTTRARANMLREILTHSDAENPFAHPDLYAVMDLCLSCKGCASECPSNVDMATLKAEFLHQYYRQHGVPLRTRLIAHIARINRLGIQLPGLTNFFLKRKILKRILGIAPARPLPTLHRHSLRTWYRKHKASLRQEGRKVYFFCDEFTNYNDVSIGITAIRLLDRLGYQVDLIAHADSGRTQLSKGLLKAAQKAAIRNVEAFRNRVSAESPLLGLEPSALLSFRDEYPRLVPDPLKDAAHNLSEHAYLIEEFLVGEIASGHLKEDAFTSASRHILLHGHCHQKALASQLPTQQLLSFPANYTVEIIPSGCCGMAGSFGYEKEHYVLSQQIGELVLFPSVRAAEPETLIAAPGTSCRHQIEGGTGRKAQHPVEILWAALG